MDPLVHDVTASHPRLSLQQLEQKYLQTAQDLEQRINTLSNDLFSGAQTNPYTYKRTMPDGNTGFLVYEKYGTTRFFEKYNNQLLDLQHQLRLIQDRILGIQERLAVEGAEGI